MNIDRVLLSSWQVHELNLKKVKPFPGFSLPVDALMASDALMVREFTIGAGQRAPETPGEVHWCHGVRVPPRRIVPLLVRRHLSIVPRSLVSEVGAPRFREDGQYRGRLYWQDGPR